jgi:L-rhamnose mutarotase
MEKGSNVQRVAFQLRIRPGMTDAYDEAHRHVWPELLKELRESGVREYSIFRRGQQLFLTMRVPDFQQFLAQMAVSDVNRRWQETMSPLFEPVPDLSENEPLAMMTEVFYMSGDVMDDELQ